jgi:hypothetical protein
MHAPTNRTRSLRTAAMSALVAACALLPSHLAQAQGQPVSLPQIPALEQG